MENLRKDISLDLAKLILIAVVAIIIVANLPYLDAFFSQDDFAGLTVHADNAGEFAQFFSPEPEGNRPWYRPASFQIRFWLMHQIFGFNPRPYHILSLALHVLNMFLVFKVARSLIGRNDISLISSALYGLNGSHQMSLYWFSAGNEILTATFFLIGVAVFVSLVSKPSTCKIAGICLLYILMLLSKESSIIFPFILMLTWYIFRSTVPQPSELPRNLRILKYSLGLILVAYLLFWFSFQYQPNGGQGYGLVFNPFKILANLAVYLAQVFIGDSILYKWMSSLTGDSSNIRSLVNTKFLLPLLIGGSAVVALFGFWLRRNWVKFSDTSHRMIIWGAGWSLICMLPVLPLVEHNYAYYMTTALVGIAAALASFAIGLAEIYPGRKNLRVVGYVLLALYASNFAVNTHLAVMIRTIPQHSVIAKKAFDEFIPEHPSFNTGSLLFILDVNPDFHRAVADGMMYRAFYGDGLRYCHVLVKGSKVTLDYLTERGWSEERDKYYFSYDGDEYIQRDERYFIENYLASPIDG